MDLLDSIGNLITDALAGKQVDLIVIALVALGSSGDKASAEAPLQV